MGSAASGGRPKSGRSPRPRRGFSGPPPDGRTARGERTRIAIADALLDLIQEGNLRPPAHRIAERAGVSLRSVFVHFSDLEDLLVVAGSRHLERIGPLFRPIPDDGPLENRIRRFVAQRTRWYEAAHNIHRAAELQEPFAPQVAAMLRTARAAARDEIERIFALELQGRPRPEYGRLLAALDAAGSFGAWTELRLNQGLSKSAAAAAMALTLASLLG